MSSEECDFNSVDDEIYNINSKISSQKDDMHLLANCLNAAIEIIKKSNDTETRNEKLQWIQDNIDEIIEGK